MFTHEYIDDLLSDLMVKKERLSEVESVFRQPIERNDDEELMKSQSELWSYVFDRQPEFPRLGVAKKIVELAMLGDTAYPILTNDTVIISLLSEQDKVELFEYIKQLIGNDRTSVGASCLAEFADELVGSR